jgi:hypothetical protein
MEAGSLDLKAWGIGIGPQAQLHFNGELIAKDQYIPLLSFLKSGKKLTAQRCRACALVTFEYAAAH